MAGFSEYRRTIREAHNTPAIELFCVETLTHFLAGLEIRNPFAGNIYWLPGAGISASARFAFTGRECAKSA